MQGNERAQKIINDAKKLGVPTFLKSQDIVSGNPKLNLLFCAEIFNSCPGLTPTEEEKYAAAGLLDDDVEGSREERSFRMWINSLGIDGVYVNNLYNDVGDGIVLLKVLDRIQPGSVNWKKVEINPNNKFKKINNCNECVNTGKDMKFSLVGIGGVDLHDGNKKLTLALVW